MKRSRRGDADSARQHALFDIHNAGTMRRGILLEVSGGVTLDTVRAIAESGRRF